MAKRSIRLATATAVALAFLATPVLWTPLAFGNGESRAAVLTTWLVVPILPLVGAWVARSRPENPVGWLLLVIGVSQSLGMLHGQLTVHATTEGWSEDAVAWLTWSGGPFWIISVPVFPIVLLLFPDGRPPTSRWRPALYLAIAGPVLMLLGGMFLPGPIPGSDVVADNPVGIAGLEPLRFLAQLGMLLTAVAVVLAAASLVARWRRSIGVERLQLRWVAFAVSVTAVVIVAGLPTPPGSALEVLGLLLALGGVPASIGVAIARHRLYDLPVVINRTLTYGLATAFLLAAYAGMTAVTLRLLSWEDTTSALSATAVVAVLFGPVRDRAQRFVDRRVFGARRDPYDALVRLGRDLEAYMPVQTALQVLADSVREALRVPYAAVLLDEATVGADAYTSGTATDVVVAVPLRHRGEGVGSLVVCPRPPDEGLGTADLQVLEAMAGQAGPAVQAARLQAQIQGAAARRAAAVEEERRRLRRDLHDGLGPTLAGIGLGIENAERRTRLAGDSDTAAMLLRLGEEVQNAVSSVRGLAYGLRPPALDELGLAGALHAAVLTGTDRMVTDLRVDGLDPTEPLPAAVEVAAYRIAVEAVSNARRHARAGRCSVQVVRNGTLTITVSDDGVGLPDGWQAGVGVTSMRERAGELGGVVTLRSREGGGTEVVAVLPTVEVPAGGTTDA